MAVVAIVREVTIVPGVADSVVAVGDIEAVRPAILGTSVAQSIQFSPPQVNPFPTFAATLMADCVCPAMMLKLVA